MAFLAVCFWAFRAKNGISPMSNKWRARLTEVLEADSAVHNTHSSLRAHEEVSEIRAEEKPKTPENRTAKNAKNNSGASERGLVATWAATFGFVSIHDPTTGEWHDVQTKQAPDWALAEASTRKTLYKSGNRKAYSLNAPQMEEIWETEHPPPEEGIVEEYPIEGEDQGEPVG
jgi:hypothetical protein